MVTDSQVRDLNTRIKEIDRSLAELGKQLEESKNTLQQEFQNILAGILKDIEKTDTSNELDYLESNYQNLEKKTGTLTKETARLAVLLEKNEQQQYSSLNEVEEQLSKDFSKISEEVNTVNHQVGQISQDYENLLEKTASLVKELFNQTKMLKQTVAQHDEAVKDLGENIQQQNSQNQSRLEQVKHNFSFHDTKILNLHEKNAELEDQTRTILATLQQDEAEQAKRLQSIENKLELNIQEVSDTVKEYYNNLSSEYQLAASRQTDLESIMKGLVSQTGQIETRISDSESQTNQIAGTLEQFKRTHTRSLNNLKESSKRQHHGLQAVFQSNLKKTDEQFYNHSLNLSAHEKNLSEHETHMQTQAYKLEQLKTIGDKYVNELFQMTQQLNLQGQASEKTTSSLQQQNQYFRQNFTELAVKNNLLEQKTKQIEEQVSKYTINTEKNYHLLSSGFAVLSMVTIAALIYTFLQQQNLWQESLHNAVVIERQMNEQIAQQHVALIEVEQQRMNLNSQLLQINEQLNAEQQKSDSLALASQNKSLIITRLKSELQEVDENVQYLNQSVGPFSNYHRAAHSGKLNNEQWLANQPENNYAIQLTSVKSKQAIYQFIDRNAYTFNQILAYFTIRSDGVDYFVLTYGSFNDIAKAREALKRLPWSVSAKSPGIASLTDIQKIIDI